MLGILWTMWLGMAFTWLEILTDDFCLTLKNQPGENFEADLRSVFKGLIKFSPSLPCMTTDAIKMQTSICIALSKMQNHTCK